MSKIGVTLGGYAFEVDINSGQRMDSEVTVQINGETIRAVVPETGLPIDQLGWIIVDGRPHEIVIDSELSWIKAGGGLHVLEVRDLEAPVTRPVSLDSRIKAPIPGIVTLRSILERKKSSIFSSKPESFHWMSTRPAMSITKSATRPSSRPRK